MNALADIRAPLPINLEAEQALLGATLLNNDAIPAVASFLQPEHFSEPVHRETWRVILEMSRAGQKATPLTVRDFLPADLAIGDTTLGAYLAHLAASATTIINAPSYA